MGNDKESRTAPQAPSKTPASTAGSTAVGKQTRVDQGEGTGQAGGIHFAPGGIPLPQSVVDAAKPKPPDLTVHAPEEMGDAIAQFRIALDKGDADGAQLAWSMAKPADKQKFGKSSTINLDLRHVAKVTGPLTIHVMAESGLDFAGRTDLIDYMLQVGFPHWFDGLDDVGGTLMATFLANLPQRDALNDKALVKLDRIIADMNSLPIIRPLFERVYVPLSDTTYNSKKVRTAPWNAHAIHRLYKVLREHLPLAHVRTIKAFHLGREKKVGHEWIPASNAWWNTAGYVVLPETDAAAKVGKDRDHRMTGGTRAFSDPKTNKGQVLGEMDRFDVGALHEVGHGVGDQFGGHKWAASYAYVGWQTNMNIDAWSQGLWGNDTALTLRAKHRADGGTVVTSVDARHFLANRLLKPQSIPAGWKSVDAYQAAILKQYGDQPLASYFKKCQDNKNHKDWYKFSGTENFGGDGRVYVYCERGTSGYSSYNQAAFKQKVSWYSLSSPHEWFAEQYAHYYRLGKTGEGLETGVAKKLAELDVQQPPAQQPAQPAQGGTGPGEDLEGDDSEGRVPFPW